MKQTKEQTDAMTESSAAKLAFYLAWIPLVGWMFYIPFAFLGLLQIGKGRTGFNLLGKGLTAVVLLSVLPIAGLTYWAKLPSECYPVLNKLTKHGRYYTLTNGQLVREEYYRFGQQFRAVTYRYHANGKKRSQATWVNGKLNGKSYYWFDNGQLRADEIFVNGKRHGRFTWYTRDGKLERTMDYTDGISQEQIDAAKQAGVEPVIEVDLGGGVKMRMIFIPPGEFMMGSSEAEREKVKEEADWGFFDNEESQHKATIKQGFYLCETEVTQAQWKVIMQENHSYFKDGISNAPKDTHNHPVENISCDDVEQFLQKISTKGKATFRLPSEAEWEYSARARSITNFGHGDEYADLGDYAWYLNNSKRTTHTVSGKKANNWGLHDMHGNVWEWCEDDNHDNCQGAPNEDSDWPDAFSGSGRLLRGGSWLDIGRFCLSSFCFRAYPLDWRNGDGSVGLRLAMTLR